MKFNPEKHHRRSIRVRGYDYTQAGAYSVTLCTYQRQCLFGEITNGTMHLNLSGQFVQACWNNLPNHFASVQLDAYVVMPNHIHGIIIIIEKNHDVDVGTVGAKHLRGKFMYEAQECYANASPCVDSSLPEFSGTTFSTPKGTKSGSLGAILQNFKSVSTRKINRMDSTSGETIWQRNYHEHIIRDENSLHQIRQYITHNPKRWIEDPENPRN